jgi:Glycosyl hydrolases family 16
MHGSARPRPRRSRVPRGRFAEAALAAAGAVLVVAVVGIVAVTHRPGLTPRASLTHRASPTHRADVSPAARASVPPPRPALVRRSAPPAKPSSAPPVSTTPTVASYEGSLLVDESGAGLASWQSPATCTGHNWTANGSVTTGPGGNVLLTTTGGDNSCASLASPGAYSSAVIEADIDFPASPGNPGIVANWDAFWLTDPAEWPEAGELDAIETEPPTGVNAVSWHSGTGTTTPSYNVSTADDGWSRGTPLPTSTGNLTPGWHTIDIVYTKGFFAVYYDGSLYTSFTNGNVTGDPLNVYLTSDVDPNSQNADSSPATIRVAYLKIWSYR